MLAGEFYSVLITKSCTTMHLVSSLNLEFEVSKCIIRGVAGGPDNRGAVRAENSTAEDTLGIPPQIFLIEFVQISGVHLIVPGGSGPPASYAAVYNGVKLLLKRVLKLASQYQ
jgi:hypothetical protein